MDRDGLTHVTNNISNYETLKELLFNSTIEEDLKIYLIELFNKFNFNDFEIFFESIEDEVTMVFFPNKNNDDSGKLTFYIKKDHYKIYIYGCKFPFNKEEFKIKSHLALDGKYFVKEITYKRKTISYEVSLADITKKIEFGLFNLFKPKSRNKIKEYKGIVFTE